MLPVNFSIDHQSKKWKKKYNAEVADKAQTKLKHSEQLGVLEVVRFS